MRSQQARAFALIGLTLMQGKHQINGVDLLLAELTPCGSQRWTWLQIGRQYPEVEVWCVTLDVSKTSCLNRLQTREFRPLSPVTGLTRPYFDRDRTSNDPRFCDRQTRYCLVAMSLGL